MPADGVNVDESSMHGTHLFRYLMHCHLSCAFCHALRLAFSQTTTKTHTAYHVSRSCPSLDHLTYKYRAKAASSLPSSLTRSCKNLSSTTPLLCTQTETSRRHDRYPDYSGLLQHSQIQGDRLHRKGYLQAFVQANSRPRASHIPRWTLHLKAWGCRLN